MASIVGGTTSTNGKVTARKLGTTTITATATDGSGKKAKVKIKVVEFQKGPSESPVIEKDPRIGTTVEDFESYPAGTTWSRFTAGGYANSGKMTVVEDPENPKNKVLKIEYNGNDQAYDFAPIFSLTLPDGKKLGDFSAIRMKSRMIANTAECNYKSVYCYFDGANTIKSEDYFATSNFDGTNPKEVPDRKNRFGVKISMATGVDKNYNVPAAEEAGNAILDKDIISISPGKKYNNKQFPTYYQDYSNGDLTAVSPGYSENETTAENKVGFQQNTLELDNTRIAAANITGDDQTPLLERNQLDMVLGSTYSGSMGKTYEQAHMTLYLDDIQVMSGEIPCTAMKFVNPVKKLACGNPEKDIPAGTAKLEVAFEPLNTTQRDVTYTSSDESLAKVEADGTVTANNDNKQGSVVITATNKANPAISVSTTIVVESIEPATEDYSILTDPSTKIVAKGEEANDTNKVISNVDTFSLANGELNGTFNAANVSVVLDLGKEINVNRYKGVEISGVVPGQISMEFYGSDFDMSKTKDKGAEKDWWETSAGQTQPFYVGSCNWRFEGGGMNYLKAFENGFVNPTAPTDKGDAIASPETLRYSLNTLGSNGNGDWSAVRYVVIKTNKDPILSEKYKFDAKSKTEGRTEFAYKITGLKFVAESMVEAKDEGHYLMDTTKNVAEQDGNVTSYYVDNITDDNPVAKHSSSMNLSDFKYIKVKVKDATSVKVGLITNGKKLADTQIIGEETGSGERSIYFSLKKADKEILKNLDAISIELDGGSITGLSATKGEISYDKAETKFDVEKTDDGYSVTPVTLEAYGTEKS